MHFSVTNIHQRVLRSDLPAAGLLVNHLGSKNDKLWPVRLWPSMKFDRELQVGAQGGHGPIRYFAEAMEPGRSVTFRFTGPKGFNGIHKFFINELEPGLVKLEHRIEMKVKGIAIFTWPLIFRPLHDALLEDALDRAESYISGTQINKRKYSLRVRFLRWIGSRKKTVN